MKRAEAFGLAALKRSAEKDPMIAKLSKEQVAKLSPEQQEVVARLAIAEGKERRDLLERARGYRGYNVFPWILFALGFLFWGRLLEAEILIAAVAVGSFALIQFHAAGVNSRITAVWRLLDEVEADESNDEAEQGVPAKSDRAGG